MARRMGTWGAWLVRGGALGLGLLWWEWGAGQLNSLLFPTFSATVVALAELVREPRFWASLWLSNQSMILGFALASTVGVTLGLLMGRVRRAERWLDPYLNILLVTPMSALIPMVIMATGIGLLSRVLIVFGFAVVTIAVQVRAGMRLVDPAWIEMARAFGASEWSLWRKVLLRGALPGIAVGLRLGLVRCVAGMVTVELLLVALGLGRLLLEAQGNFDAARMYATVLVVVVESVLLQQGAGLVERRLLAWGGQGAL